MRTQEQPEGARSGAARVGVEQAEAALVEHYPRLVRLAYITLPPSLGRHRRALAAHAAVQRALPASRDSGPDGPRVPVQRGTSEDPGYALVRQRVLATALAYGQRPGWWPRQLPAPRALRPALPAVFGLRIFPRSGGADELALEQALSGTTAAARAALVLHRIEGLSEQATRTLLTAAGATDAGSALRTALRLARTPAETGADALLRSDEFDPCLVHTRPTDLIRRRQRVRFARCVGIAVTVLAVALVVVDRDGSSAPSAATGPFNPAVSARAVDPALLLRAPAQQWADSSRMDFTVWPARGARKDDTALLGRALKVWASPSRTVRISATQGAATTPPAQPSRLLYAGDVDGAAVVLFADGERVVRYAEPTGGKGAPALDFARTDDADITTGAAVVVGRTDGNARFLLAPWVAESGTRDLLAPDAPARPLDEGKDGVTAPVSSPATVVGGKGCGSWPALQLRSSSKVAEKHAFLLTDLGDLTPVHLTYTPPPGGGVPARQPREATGSQALVSWAHTACSLTGVRGSGVRAVNNWEYARQQLPDNGGRASWVCTRADTWQGPGRVSVQLQLPTGPASRPGVIVAQQKNTALCSRFGQNVLAGAKWKSGSGRWYLLAAGSREVRRIDATGGVRATADGTTLAVRAGKDDRAVMSARLANGDTLKALG
ncbi:hypothetical protein [Streptomyces sp. NBC_01306]|uniref:hypothetical protein n=1 Tax=Streptomyces sp. NBC_01306 TaxID=2903819 RepID=UPI002259BB08|nr:hypothetical protein [Streptomyces sp. NBC_01306]MCX4727037.1 hypothetical protein [Streptomyces sp. NBC_01306]